MRGSFVALTIGGVLVYSGLKGQSIIDVLSGAPSDPLDPHGGRHRDPSTGTMSDLGSGDLPHGSSASTPQSIVDQLVIPMARKHGINVTPESVVAANRRHSPITLSGRRSDHNGPPDIAWAADMSNGYNTPQEAALAAELADFFDIPWNGSGMISATHGHFRYQLGFRTLIGGNHFTHVHFGVKKV